MFEHTPHFVDDGNRMANMSEHGLAHHRIELIRRVFQLMAIAGLELHPLPLLEENQFLPDLTAIPAEVARQARVMILSYPNNPTAAVAPASFFRQAIEFCTVVTILCPNCDHENSCSVKALHNLSKSLRIIFSPNPQCVPFSLL